MMTSALRQNEGAEGTKGEAPIGLSLLTVFGPAQPAEGRAPGVRTELTMSCMRVKLALM